MRDRDVWGRKRGLRKIVRRVHRRWRMRHLVRGSSIVVGAGLVLFLLSSYGIDRFRFTPTAILGFRIFTWTVLGGLFLWFVVRPLLRRVTDEQVALYLEEHEPSLEASVISALDANTSASGNPDSEAFTRRLVEVAIRRCREVDEGRRIDRRALRLSSAWLAGLTTTALILFGGGPGFVGDASPLLFKPWSSADAASPYSIEVLPGDARVPRGADQRIVAHLVGFETSRVELAVRRGTDGAWERWEMGPDPETTGYEILLFDVDVETEYLVEADGVRSPLFRLDVADLPFVDFIDLEYRFPDYTGLEPQLVDNGGDVAALRGTTVILRVTPTIPVASGRIVREGTDPIDLLPNGDGTLGGRFVVDVEGFYRIELDADDGTPVEASPEYLIEPLDDQPPSVMITRPGQDTRATAIDEVFMEVKAEDDYGVGRLELVYSVNGAEEQTIALYGSGRGMRDVSRGHTFFLEEFALEPGDLISYFARAVDVNRVGGRQTTTTDIYFLQIEPFDRTFRQADQAPGGQQGSPNDAMTGALSDQQRQIVAATFRVVRDSADFESGDLGENLATLALVQGRLREQVEGLVDRMMARGVVADSAFLQVAELLPMAAEQMIPAEESLGRNQPREALPSEQRALQYLQRAEAVFRDMQVSMQQGGDGGRNPSNAEDLADLFELELDKLRNQYETVERGERRQQEAEVDEAMQTLQELARRQQQMNERARRQNRGAQSQADGARGQSQLIEETEEVARRLERLARQTSRRELAESARRLREAADQMRRAATRGESSRPAGISALDRLREARRGLEHSRSAEVERSVQDALDRARRVAEQQQRVSDEVERLGAETGARRQEKIDRLTERKNDLTDQVTDLETDLDRLASETRSEQPEVSGSLREAAGSIRSNKLKEKIRYSREIIRGRSPEYARNFEREISDNVDDLVEAVGAASDSFRRTDDRRLQAGLDDTRDLVQGLESLRERIRQSSEQARQEVRRLGQRPQDGQRSENGQVGDGELSSGDARQFRQEFGQRRRDAEQLRDQLAREGVDVGELERAIGGLRALHEPQALGDLDEIDELQASIIRGLKEFEFSVRRENGDADADRLFLSGSDEVPPEYRPLVEEYYRSLSEDRSN